ncbi:MAG: insulinase family protein [Acidobacteria bacterium]|nr:insulinase family protein [Acidobacteriota bacterium]
MGHPFVRVETLDGFTEWRHPDNGLTVLVCATPVAPVASFCVVYRVGSRDEVTGQTGATHLLEHLMFKGTERYNRERGTEIARVLQRVGASFNASTWLDRTNYYETVPVERLDLAMEVEADRMRGTLLREEDLESERTVVLNELERGENDPFDLLIKASFAHAYLEHPYHHPTIGWRSDVEKLSQPVLRRFYDTFYHPGNATVMVVGDVDEAGALTRVDRHFGGMAAGPEPLPRIPTRESEQRGERRFELHRAGEVGWLALSWHIPEGLHPDLPALSVLAQVLAEGVTSRLHRKLVETNLCLGVHAFAWELHDPGLFQVFATLAPGTGHDDVEELIRREVALLAQSPLEPEELARARVQVRTDLAFHRESPATMVSALTEAVAVGDWRRFLRELTTVEAVDAEDVRRVCGTYLRDLNLTVGRFIPDGAGGAAPEVAPAPHPCWLREPLSQRVAVHRLDNGARLAVLENPHAPTVTIAGSLIAGRAFAPGGKASVPSMTAAMLDRGTVRHTRMELARELEDHGLELNIEAPAGAPTVVSFSAQGLAEELPRLVALLAEVLQEPAFPEEELEKLRTRVLGLLARERQETFPNALGALTRRLYPAGHPHRRRTVEEREAEVRGLGREELTAFHRRLYGPASLVVAVVGQVGPDEARRVFAGNFGQWRGGVAAPPPAPPALPPQPAEELISIPDRPNVDVLLGHAAALVRGAPDQAAAVLANACLGQSTLTSRLGVEVRDRAGLTYGVYSRFFGTLHIPGPWAVYLGVAPDNLRRAQQLCVDIVERFVEEGPTEEEVAEQREAQAGSYTVGLATNSGVARELVAVLTSGEGVEHLASYPRSLMETSRAEVAAAARKHLHPDALVMTAAGSV